MRKAIGVIGLVFGILYVLMGIGFAILFGVLADIIKTEMYNTWILDPEYANLKTSYDMMIVFAVIYGLLFLVYGVMQIINGAVAFSRIKDKTVGVVSIVFGALTNTVTLILGIIMVVKSNEVQTQPAVNIVNASLPLNTNLIPIDNEIEALKKQIELSKLKQYERALNVDKYIELDKLKKELADLNKK